MSSILWKKLTKQLVLFSLGCFLLTSQACAPTEVAPAPGLPAVTDLSPTLVETRVDGSSFAHRVETPTTVWFPATRTPTPFFIPEPSATPKMLPGLGQETYRDDFSSPARWSNLKTQSDGGNAALLDRNRMTLAVNVTPAYLASLNTELLLTNFYVETTARVNRCMDADSYGLLFRAAAEFFAYRYILNCKGEVRVERMRNTEIAVLQPWEPSGDSPPGSPGEVKLGIWVSGVEMRFFLNDRYQFSIFDRYFTNGGLGVFASTSNPLGMNISFSDLVVYSVDYVSPTPTFTPTNTPKPSRTPRP